MPRAWGTSSEGANPNAGLVLDRRTAYGTSFQGRFTRSNCQWEVFVAVEPSHQSASLAAICRSISSRCERTNPQALARSSARRVG